MSRIPGLSNIPLLGALFKSTDLAKNLSELVVIVTPEIARPLAPGEPAPIPVMPKEFLVPLKTNPQSSSLDGGAVHEAREAEKRARRAADKPEKIAKKD
jgi:Flp pilus assembly secretin CpaC